MREKWISFLYTHFSTFPSDKLFRLLILSWATRNSSSSRVTIEMITIRNQQIEAKKPSVIKQILFDCRKTKTDVITTAHQTKRIWQGAFHITKQKQANCVKLGKNTVVTESRLVGWLEFLSNWLSIARVFWTNNWAHRGKTDPILDYLRETIKKRLRKTAQPWKIMKQTLFLRMK